MERPEREPTRDELLAAIRRHMNETGDDRCHADDGRLYSVLPEGDTRPERTTLVTIENCIKYIACRQSGREYISPQRRIEELEAEVATLKEELEKLKNPCPNCYSIKTRLGLFYYQCPKHYMEST